MTALYERAIQMTMPDFPQCIDQHTLLSVQEISVILLWQDRQPDKELSAAILRFLENYVPAHFAEEREVVKLYPKIAAGYLPLLFQQETSMKHFKKIFVCLLSLTILFSSQLMYTNAAVVVENEVMSTTDSAIVYCSKDDVCFFFYFSYSDGNSASFVRGSCHGTGCTISSMSSLFDNDTCYATIIVTTASGAQITFNAWCDIYGQTGSY